METNKICNKYKINFLNEKCLLDQILVFFKNINNFEIIALKGESAKFFNEDIKNHIIDFKYHLSFLKNGFYIIELTEIDDNDKYEVTSSRSFNIELDKF